MQQFFMKIEVLLMYTNIRKIIGFKIIENQIILFLLTHIATCSWLLINKVQPDNENGFFERVNKTEIGYIS